MSFIRSDLSPTPRVEPEAELPRASTNPVLNVSSQPEAAFRTNDAAKKTFQILEVNGQRMLVYVTETTAEGATFLHEADDYSFQKLGEFVAPVLQGLAGRATHFQIEVKPEKIIVKSPTQQLGELNTEDLALSHPIRQCIGAYQNFMRHSKVIPAQGNFLQQPAAPRTPTPTPPSVAEPAPSPEPAPAPAQSIFKHMENTLRSSDQIDSQTVIGSMQVLKNKHPTSAVEIPCFENNGGMICLEARNDAPAEQQFANYRLKKIGEKIAPHYLAIRRGTATSGHFVGVMIKPNGNSYALHYYDPKGESADQHEEFADQLAQFLHTNGLEAGKNLTVKESSSKDQGDTNHVDCGAFVVRDFEAELSGDEKLRKTPIKEYRTALATQIAGYPSTLWKQSGLSEPVVASIPASQYPASDPVATDRRPFIFSAENPIDLAVSQDALLICAAPRILTDHTIGTATTNELRRRTNLSTLPTEAYLQKQVDLILHRGAEGGFYSLVQPKPITALFTLPGDLLNTDVSSNSLTPDAKKKLADALYTSLRHAKAGAKKKLVLPMPKLPATANRKEIIELYESVFKLAEFDNAFDEIVLTAAEEKERRDWNRAWDPDVDFSPRPVVASAPTPAVDPSATNSYCAVM